MSQTKYIPVPYFQFVPDAIHYDLTKSVFEAVPNKKIHRHCPYIVIDADYINEPLMDVAVATEETPSVPDSAVDAENSNVIATPTDKASNNNTVNEGSKTGQTEQQTAQEGAVEATEETNTPSSKELSEKEKDRLDFLANLKADPANAHPESDKSANSVATKDSLAADNQDNKQQAQTEAAVSASTHAQPTNGNAPKNSSQPQDNGTDDKVESTQSKPSQPTEQVENKASTDESVKSQQKKSKKKKEDDEEISEEEKQKQEKEAKLESYKQFLAEQKSKIDIDYPGIRVDIEANALPSRMYFIMNALSAIIASYGLVINSAAVVIGAMLVAMMLGPISGAALAIIDYRIPFLRKSLFTVLAGAAMVVIIGFIVGFLHQDTPLTNEILSRTQPTSMDLMIALAGGTAGAYAMISPHLSVAVVGVAVATALVPPLAASGILFAHGESTLGWGALLLAITNIIAIQFTNALVLWSAGFRRLVDDDYKTSPMMAFFRRNAVPLLLLIGIGAYLTYNFNTITKKQKFENEVKESLNDYFIDKGNALANTQFVEREDYQNVRAVIRGETRPSSSDAQYLEQQINHRIEEEYSKYKPVHLQLRYIPVIVIESSPNHRDEIDETDAAILANE